jgi:hypothetical protein
MAEVVVLPISVPEPRDDDLADVVGATITPKPRVPKLGWSALEPEHGFPMFAVKKTAKSAPESITPEEAVRYVMEGAALDRDGALAAIEDLGRRAQYGSAKLRRYQAVVDAYDRRQRVERRRRALEKAGIESGDSVDPRNVVLWTSEDVCSIFSISERTLARWDGVVIPRSIKLGGRRYWRMDSILARVEAA